MIYLRLSGGLGNQLYQLAAASLLATNSKQNVILETDGLKHYDVARNADSLKLLMPNNWLQRSVKQNAIASWLSVNVRAGRFFPFFGVNDQNFWRITRMNNHLQPLFLDGYFQVGWEQRAFSRALLTMPINRVSDAAANRIARNEVAVHIRGGDFLRLPKYRVVDEKFYTQCISEAIAHGLTHFAVMTDDIQYSNTICEKILGSLPEAKLRIIPPGLTTIDDFDVLRSASARIIGNSTFAWWASALGLNSSPTWSPKSFTTDCKRDFFLPNERMPHYSR